MHECFYTMFLKCRSCLFCITLTNSLIATGIVVIIWLNDNFRPEEEVWYVFEIIESWIINVLNIFLAHSTRDLIKAASTTYFLLSLSLSRVIAVRDDITVRTQIPPRQSLSAVVLSAVCIYAELSSNSGKIPKMTARVSLFRYWNFNTSSLRVGNTE